MKEERGIRLVVGKIIDSDGFLFLVNGGDLMLGLDIDVEHSLECRRSGYNQVAFLERLRDLYCRTGILLG